MGENRKNFLLCIKAAKSSFEWIWSSSLTQISHHSNFWSINLQIFLIFLFHLSLTNNSVEMRTASACNTGNNCTWFAAAVRIPTLLASTETDFFLKARRSLRSSWEDNFTKVIRANVISVGIFGVLSPTRSEDWFLTYWQRYPRSCQGRIYHLLVEFNSMKTCRWRCSTFFLGYQNNKQLLSCFSLLTKISNWPLMRKSKNSFIQSKVNNL